MGVRMLLLEAQIAQRLRDSGAFTGWAVREGCQDVDRRAVPALDVRLSGAGVPKVSKPVVTLQPEWVVSIVTRRGDGAAQQLDAALAAVIGSLHNWRPATGVHGWTELQLSHVRPADFVEAALIGCELVFTTAAIYRGQT